MIRPQSPARTASGGATQLPPTQITFGNTTHLIRQFDAAQVLDILEHEGITVFAAVRGTERVGATRVVALLVRAQPSSQIYVSMDLTNGSVREDPAPYGWTYLGPPR